MKRRFVAGLVILVLGAIGAVGAILVKPILAPYYWKWRSGVEEVEVAGRVMTYRDIGEGMPAIVIINGLGISIDGYYDLQKRLAGESRVIDYDRAGLGDSTPTSEPRTLDYIDRDMKAFLQALGVPPPYILVGHSLGGHIIRYYADKHPEDVAGLVFLDAPHEDWFRYIRNTWTPEESASYFEWWSADNEAYSGVPLEELLAYEPNCDMVRGIRIPPHIPVLMFTGNNDGHFRKTQPGKDEDWKNWAEMQASMLEDVAFSRQIVDRGVGHMMYRDRPEWVVDEINKFIREVRSMPPGTSGVSPSSLPPATSTVTAADASP